MAIIKLSMQGGKTLSYDDSKGMGKPGGEGAVFEVVAPARYRDYCVKIYAEQKLVDPVAAAQREEKIKYMAQFSVVSRDPKVVICWPENPVYRGGKFCGFLMRKAFPNSIQLEWLKHYALAKWLSASPFVAFDGKNALKAVYNRLVLANNIAYAIHQVHATGMYVLVDTKPQNILVNAGGEVSLVDLDSVQVAEGATLRFEAPVCTAEYKPPEAHDGRLRKAGDAVISKSWDCFSYAIMAYQLIIGSHPYTGTYRAPYDNGHDLMYKIKAGLFLHGNKASSYLDEGDGAALKATYARWLGMPEELRNAFMRAFEAGQYNPEVRPDMAQWGKVLEKAIKELLDKIQEEKTSSPPTPAPTPASLNPIPDTSSERKYLRYLIYLVSLAVFIWWLFFRSPDPADPADPVPEPAPAPAIAPEPSLREPPPRKPISRPVYPFTGRQRLGPADGPSD